MVHSFVSYNLYTALTALMNDYIVIIISTLDGKHLKTPGNNCLQVPINNNTRLDTYSSFIHNHCVGPLWKHRTKNGNKMKWKNEAKVIHIISYSTANHYICVCYYYNPRDISWCIIFLCRLRILFPLNIFMIASMVQVGISGLVSFLSH